MRYDTVVIGGGLTGLTTSLVLSKNGQKVALIEKFRNLAPLLKRFKRDGVYCDPGVHYVGGIHNGGPLNVLLKYLGVMDQIHPVPMDSDGYDYLQFSDNKSDIYFRCGVDEIRESLFNKFPKEKEVVLKYINEIQNINNSTPFLSYNLTFQQFQESVFDKRHNDRLFDFLQSINASDEFIRFIGNYSYLLCGVKADNISIDMHSSVVWPYFVSSSLVARGGDEFVDPMEEKIRQTGVDIYCNVAASKFIVDSNQKLQAIKLNNNEILQTDKAVYTGHPQIMESLLPDESIYDNYRSKLVKFDNTFSCYCVYLKFDQIPNKFTGKNYYFADINDRYVAQKGLAVCAAGSNNASEKKALCLVYGINDQNVIKRFFVEGQTKATYESYKQEFTGQVLKQFDSLFPEVKGKYKVAAVATPRAFERYSGTKWGSTYGLQRKVGLSLKSRTPINGLLLAGQSIMAPGVLGCVVSGFLISSRIMGMEKLWSDLQKCR